MFIDLKHSINAQLRFRRRLDFIANACFVLGVVPLSFLGIGLLARILWFLIVSGWSVLG